MTLSSAIKRFHRDNGSWSAETVIDVANEPLEGWPLEGGVPGLITDLVLSLDDRDLFFSNWLHGDLRHYDVSDPEHPQLKSQVWLGGLLGRDGGHPKASGPLTGAPQMLQNSLDGDRVYVSNSLYSTWDNQFYPDLRGWLDEARPPGRRQLRARRGLLRRLRRAGRRRPPARDPPAGRRLHDGDLPVAVSLHAFATEWGTDGPIGLAFTLLAVASGVVYLLAAAIGQHRDRRGRRWPLRRTACFIAGLVVLVVDLDSGIGGSADDHLAAHMIEHMVMWLIVAPLLAAGGPVRLALFACGRDGRRRLARWLHSRPVTVLTSPVGSVGLFAIVLLGTHIPAVYDLTLSSEWVHVSEHALYLFCSILIWAPLLGVDPLPGRADARGQALCMAACMVPMAIIGAWLLAAGSPIYAHYQDALGTPGALHDQRLAGLIMLAAGIPAFGIVPLARLARLVPVAGTARSWLPEADQIVA